MTVTLDALPHRVREPHGEPEGALVLLHGRGAHEGDLFPLLDVLDPTARLFGLCPRAPLQLPPGGFHWYVSRQVGYPDRDTFLETFALASGWLEALASETAIPASRTVLGGFSQGAVMTYALGLGPGRARPAALVAFSGFLPAVGGFNFDLSNRRGLPVAIGHGSYDQVISVEFGRDARRRLEEAGAAVLYRESPISHGIDPSFAGGLPAWILEAVARAESRT